jgi:hypothetical protein
VRLPISWEALEPTKGAIDENHASGYDYFIGDFASRGIKVLLTVSDAPPWAAKDPAAPSGSVQPPKDPADYADFIGRLAARDDWKGKVAAYEIWSAPNTATGWAPAPNAVEYAALVKAASPKIRAADPAAKVISGGLAGGDVTFLAAAYDAA